MSADSLIQKHGGYRRLKSFVVSQLIYDYEDFLRQRGLLTLGRDDPRRQKLIDRRCTTADEVAQWVLEVHDRGLSGPRGPGGQEDASAIAANAVLVLLAVACSLLDRQLAAQAKAFETEGGFSERLYRVRSEKRSFPPTLRTPQLDSRSTKSTMSTLSTSKSIRGNIDHTLRLPPEATP